MKAVSCLVAAAHLLASPALFFFFVDGVAGFASSHSNNARAVSNRAILQNDHNCKRPRHSLHSTIFISHLRTKPVTTSTTLYMSTASTSPLFSAAVVGTVSKSVLQKALVLLAAALAIIFRTRLLWPGAGPDQTLSEPLPRATSYGCPFLGHNFIQGNERDGPMAAVNKLAAKLGRPNLFQFYAFGKPFAVLTGKDTIQQALQHEFGRKDGKDGGAIGTTVAGYPNFMAIMGDQSVLYEQDRHKHAVLRRLVGTGMTPRALVDAFPHIELAAQDQVKLITEAASSGQDIVMERICHDFTMDVAWRQILGLDLTPEESVVFRQNVDAWLAGMFSPQMYSPVRLPWIKRTKSYKARQGLVEAVEKKLQKLDRDGPDGSTLSAIYFATDEDGVTRLPHNVVIENALILIVAGSETSANTLANVMQILGLHKNVLAKLRQEQRDLVAKYGPQLTKERLEECEYLDGVIRETLRIRPIPTLEVREVSQSMVVDGQQIPKNWGALVNVRGTHDADPVCNAHNEREGQHMDVMDGFQPERWLSRETTPSEWIPFGEGARRCLGERLAMLEMKIFLATLVRELKDFDLVNISDPSKDVKLKAMSVLPAPKDGVVIRPTSMETGAPVAA